MNRLRERLWNRFQKHLLSRFFRDFQPLKRLLHTSSQMANFDQFLAKMAKMVKMVKIIKKALGTSFSRWQALTNCKVSEKSNERFPRKRVTYVRTDKRTDATPKVSTTSWSRNQKPHFLAFLRGLRGIRGN